MAHGYLGSDTITSLLVLYRTSRQVKGAVLCGNRGGVWLREAPKRLSQVWYFLPLETHRI